MAGTNPSLDQLHGRVAELEAQLDEARARCAAERLRREAAEAGLRGFAAVIAQAPVGVLVLDSDGVIVDTNPEAERLCGLPRSRLLGRPLHHLVPHDRKRRCEIVLRECGRGRVIRRVERILWGPDGGTRASSSVLLPVPAIGTGGVGTAGLGMVLCEDIRDLRGARELLENVNRDLLKLVRHDALTGLWNRREYERVLDAETARAAREKMPLSLLMIDVDDFKTFNDTFGHAAGDECLVTVAEVLGEIVHRPADFCARYGGEEFVVLLPGTDVDGARALGERMRLAVQARGVHHPAARADRVVTISIGSATVVPLPGYDGRALQELADQALYAAKREGRNRVVVRAVTAPRAGGPRRPSDRSQDHRETDSE